MELKNQASVPSILEVAKCDRESINIVRFIATMAIFNHLAAPFYGSYSFLATGGLLDVLCFSFVLGIPFR